jgi:hypothetical protein
VYLVDLIARFATVVGLEMEPLMTNTEAVALQTKWTKLVNPTRCEHLSLGLQSRDGVYLTGKYYCLACGESVTRP